MVEDRVTDGRRIAQLLSSELDGRTDGVLEGIAVVDADPDVEPTVDGARAYDVALAGSGEGRRNDEGRDGGDAEGDRDPGDERIVASVYVHPDRAHLSFSERRERVAEAARRRDLRVRPKATKPPKTLVFVEDGAAVKRAVEVVGAAFGDGE